MTTEGPRSGPVPGSPGPRPATGGAQRIAAVAVLLLLIGGGVAYLLLSKKGGTDEIVIGVLAPKTGFMSGHGQSIELGSQLATDELNARGGILGKKVKLVVLDTTSDPAGAAERTKELVDREHAVLLVGTGTSAATLAAIPPATAARVPLIYSIDGECKTCSPGNPGAVNKYVYGSGFTERMAVKPFLEFLATRFKKGNRFKIFYIGGDYVYPHETNKFAREVAEGLGYETVGFEFSDTANTDYLPLINKIRAAKPDLLIVTNPGASGVTFMRQAVLQGLQKDVVISGFATFDQEAIDTMGEASEGVYAINRYSLALDNPANKAFVEAFRKKFPDKPLLPGPTAAAGAYGSILLAAQGFEKAGATDPDKFYEAMRGLELDLPQGKVRVNPQNNIFDQHMYILRISKQQYHVVPDGDLGMQIHPGFEGCSVK